MLAKLIEINLLFAKAELDFVDTDPIALHRARRHINDAIQEIRARKRGASAKPRKQGIAVAEQLTVLAQSG
jgi:hypothetical protein